METHRIKIKIAGAEFEAEGPKELVTEQFKAFMEAVASMPDSPAPAPAAQPPAQLIVPDAAPVTVAVASTNGVPDAVAERVFAPGETVSLAALPSTGNVEADAMLAILYGYHKKGEQAVTGTSLMKSAERSGVQVSRIDRCMATYPEFVLVAGQRKARRYSLNNRGLAKAAEIIKKIVE